VPETEASARVVAVMNNRRRRYTCVFVAVSGGSVSVSATDPMPGFMEGVRIRLEPGTYQVCTTLRVARNSAVFGSAVNLALRRDGSPVATITLRVSNPNDWGLQLDIHPFTSPSWSPFGAGYAYRGIWVVEVYPSDCMTSLCAKTCLMCLCRSPLGAHHAVLNLSGRPIASDPKAATWINWAIKYTSRWRLAG